MLKSSVSRTGFNSSLKFNGSNLKQYILLALLSPLGPIGSNEMWLFSAFWLRYGLFLFLYVADSSDGESSIDVYTKECEGTNTAYAQSGTYEERYIRFKERYSNCTVVTTNLEIAFFQPPDEEYDMSFLDDIREVNGYVLILGNHVNKIPLNKLRVIRGMTLYEQRYSLYVAQNSLSGDDSIGLQELQMTSLVEILRGEVFFNNNKRLCFGENTINWEYIIGDNIDKERVPSINKQTDPGFEKVDCQSYGTCHESCTADDGKRYCWGSGSDMCQSIHTCRDCEGKRCSRQPTKSCCSSQCIAGCNEANDNSQCLSCKHYARNNGESCVDYCDTPVWNNNTSTTETPEDKFVQGLKCVKQCANNMVLQDGRCASHCKKDFMENGNSTLRECILCVGEKCIVTCDGNDATEGNKWLHGTNIHRFSKCVKVKGNLIIKNITFTGHVNSEKIDIKDLEQLSTIEEITGSLMVYAYYDGFTSLSFLRNLRKIGYDISSPVDARVGLIVAGTSLTSLELNSLESVEGNIKILANRHLCFVEEINWSKIKNPSSLKGSKNSSLCAKEGQVCSPICVGGCWGRGNDSCVSCPHFQSTDRTCVSDCPTEKGFYVNSKGIRGNQECRPCDKECDGTCNGDGPNDCVKCKHVKYLGACVAACPSQTYRDADAVCWPCSSVCDQCTGNDTVLDGDVHEQGGCSNCRSGVIRFEDDTTGRCIMSVDECGAGEFNKHEPIEVFNGEDRITRLMKACRRCHPQCNGCTDSKSSDCISCRHYRQNTTKDISECVKECSGAFYDDRKNNCLPCDNLCSTCWGPTEHKCTLCKSVRVNRVDLTDEDAKSSAVYESYCAAVCPSGLYERKNEDNTESECVAAQASAGSIGPKTAIPIFVIVFLAIFVAVAIFVLLWRRHKMRQRRANILDLEEIPANSEKVKNIRSIKEKELRRGNMIGSGTFGIVYKGIWIPEKERVKIPVAIKVLQDLCGTDQDEKLLKATRDIGSVCHPNCVRILAICFTSQLTLVTQLMPLGCLLDYVRKEKSNIGSRALFLWSIQIAKGMGYLEEIGVVHRNLAARNVLVHTPDQVRVTDFGLGKLFEGEEEEINTEKDPIKWMALESIRKRVYTHKSDVWSFGVTLWEMFSYGEKPYENLQDHQVPQALEKGERLPQPSICTIDVYTILIKCWMLDAKSRPTFPDFVNEFTRMAVEPGRYLVIQGDALMRLPSPAPATNELFRLMSLPAADADLKLISADEYLDFRGSDDANYSNSFFATQLTSIPEDATFENYSERKGSDKESDADDKTSPKLSHQSSSDPYQRYITDPCRNDAGYGGTDNDRPNGSSPIFQMDADGYLPPQSLDQDNEQQRHDVNARIGTSRDNLEYFENESALLTDAVVKNKDKTNQKESDYCNQNDSDYCNVTSKAESGSPPYKRL